MGFKKSFAAAVLAVSMIVGSVCSAAAATSPSKAPAVKNYIDYNKQDHSKTMVVSKIDSKGTVGNTVRVKAKSGKNNDETKLSIARNAQGKKVPITVVGDGKTGVFSTKDGRKVTKVIIGSSKQITVKANAFKRSNVKKLTLAGRVNIKKDAFKGTSYKPVIIQIRLKKASSVTVTKGSFNGLSSKATIVVQKSKMSAAEFKKLSSKLKKAGFKGRILRR